MSVASAAQQVTIIYEAEVQPPLNIATSYCDLHESVQQHLYSITEKSVIYRVY